MNIRLKSNKEFPVYTIYMQKKGYVEVRAVGKWIEGEKVHWEFLDSKKAFDRVANKCETIDLLFEDGSYVELPFTAFNSVFEVLPDGDMMRIIYGSE